MSPINVNPTIPKGMLGKGTLKQADHGPFYFFSPALPISRLNYRDSVGRIEPCTLTICTDAVEMLPEEQCPPGTIVSRFNEKDQVGNVKVIGASLIPAEPIKELILEMYGSWGVKEITSFAHRDAEEIDLKLFNTIFYPTQIEPWSLLTPELEEAVARQGGLAVRKDFFKKGLEFVKSKNFDGKTLRNSYIKAAEECLAAFQAAQAYVTSELNAADTDIRLRLANAGGKPTYDQRDVYFQWLLNRKPIMEAAQASSTVGQAQPVVVQFPEGFNTGLGLSKEDLVALLSAAADSAATKAVAAQTPVAPVSE